MPDPQVDTDAVRVCRESVEVARQAAAQVAPDAVGADVEVEAAGENVATHYFECLLPGYPGWRWAVSLACVPGADQASVCEVSLVPTPAAVQAPEWVPWSQRLAPTDIRPGDQLPYRPEDPHLEPGYSQLGYPQRHPDAHADPVDVSDQEADRLATWEWGLGRSRVLSAAGRDAALSRWRASGHGPHCDGAHQAQAQCQTCGYYVPMPGAWRNLVGVCANEWSPADGKVVTLDHGCGAHSETDAPATHEQPGDPVLDELRPDAVIVPRRPAAAEPSADPTTDSGEDSVTDSVVEQPDSRPAQG